MSESCRVAVLISGRGSNLRSLIEARDVAYTVVGVVSNRPEAPGLEFARSSGIATAVVDHTRYPDRNDFDAALAATLESFRPDLLVLAGFMRILGEAFVRRFEGRMINIHPSLLPAYPGLHTHERVLAAGDRWHGASTHYVTAVLDGGPVIARRRMAVKSDDTADTLAERLLPLEHRLMVRTVDLIARKEVQYRNDRVYHHDRPLQGPLEPDPPLD